MASKFYIPKSKKKQLVVAGVLLVSVFTIAGIATKLQDGSCQIWDKVYECTEPEHTQEVNQCVDRDFASAITNLEMLREIGQYYDVASQTFFNGEESKCSVKLGGALEGVFGGNCCKSQGDPDDFRDWTVSAGTSWAISKGVESLGSQYAFSMLAGNAPQLMQTSFNIAGNISGSLGFGGGTPTLSFYGLGIGISNGMIVVSFNPVGFAVAIALKALSNWLECEQDEIITAFRRDAGLCHKVGSYCHTEALGACVEKRQTYCCYISKLARIINVEGRKQIGKSYGKPENPDCSGFSVSELESLDFSKMDLSEFYEDIVAKMPDTSNMVDRAKQQTEKMKENYYDQ